MFSCLFFLLDAVIYIVGWKPLEKGKVGCKLIGSCALGCPLDTIDVTLVDAHKSAYNPIQPRDDLRSRKRPGHEFRNEIARKPKSFFKETAADIYGSPLTLEEKKRQKGSTSSAGNDRWQVSPEHQSR